MRWRLAWTDIAATLAAEGHAAAPDRQTAVPSPEIPWFVRGLTGLGAWISALFIMGFVELMSSSASEGAVFLGFGVLLVGAGVGVLRAPRGDFLTQLGLAGSLGGQALIAIGVARATDSDTGTALVALLLSLGLTAAVWARVHRFFTTLGAALALGYLVVEGHLPRGLDVLTLVFAIAASLVWLDQPRRLAATGRDALAPVGYALVVALFGVLLLSVADGSHLPLDLPPPSRIACAGLGLIDVALALTILREHGRLPPPPAPAIGLLVLALLGVATPGTPGLPGALGVLILGFHRRNPLLVGLASVFLVVFLGAFYYSLQATLLVKSVYLMTSGALLALGPLLVRRRRA